MKKCAKMRQNLFVLTTREGGCEVMGASYVSTFGVECFAFRVLLELQI